jgi:hypothetical protein
MHSNSDDIVVCWNGRSRCIRGNVKTFSWLAERRALNKLPSPSRLAGTAHLDDSVWLRSASQGPVGLLVHLYCPPSTDELLARLPIIYGQNKPFSVPFSYHSTILQNVRAEQSAVCVVLKLKEGARAFVYLKDLFCSLETDFHGKKNRIAWFLLTMLGRFPSFGLDFISDGDVTICSGGLASRWSRCRRRRVLHYGFLVC